MADEQKDIGIPTIEIGFRLFILWKTFDWFSSLNVDFDSSLKKEIEDKAKNDRLFPYILHCSKAARNAGDFSGVVLESLVSESMGRSNENLNLTANEVEELVRLKSYLKHYGAMLNDVMPKDYRNLGFCCMSGLVETQGLYDDEYYCYGAEKGDQIAREYYNYSCMTSFNFDSIIMGDEYKPNYNMLNAVKRTLLTPENVKLIQEKLNAFIKMRNDCIAMEIPAELQHSSRVLEIELCVGDSLPQEVTSIIKFYHKNSFIQSLAISTNAFMRSTTSAQNIPEQSEQKTMGPVTKKT